MSATLDHLGENITAEAEASDAADSYLAAISVIADRHLSANVSCKPTHLGLGLGQEIALTMLDRVVSEAATQNNFVRIDMESSKYTDITLELTKRLFSQFGNVGTVLQACLYRSREDLKTLNQKGIRVRLVKGAYLEPPSIAFPRKEDVDANYKGLSELLLSDGAYPAFATHDANLIRFVKQRAQELGRKPDEYEYQMLYGIRRDLQRELRDDGYRVRLYIPYGTQWYPYLMRRLAERPANLVSIVGHVAKEAGQR